MDSYEKEANNCDNNHDFEFTDSPRKRKWRFSKATGFFVPFAKIIFGYNFVAPLRISRTEISRLKF